MALGKRAWQQRVLRTRPAAREDMDIIIAHRGVGTYREAFPGLVMPRTTASG